ncbi:MAG: transcription-repair coupling factor [Acidobacteria bacterium]|nr:MAG: transcription-repair coupling factor [Acidobacteriota bacterium]
MEILEKRINKILARISDVADFRRIAADALRGETDVVVSGLSGSARALFIAGLAQALRRPLIVVTPQDRGIETLATDINYYHTELNTNGLNRVCPFPAWETDPYAGLTPHADIQQTRATTLWRLRNKQADVVVVSMRAIATRLAAPAQFDTYSLHIASGEDLLQELLIEHLASAGYLRQEPVAAPGEFSVRGGIVDVFSPLMRNPVRIEFFGDSVDSIREFDLDDQRSRGPVQYIDIVPMQDMVISREMLRQWGALARQRWACELSSTGGRFEKDLNEKLMFADNGELFPGALYLMPIVQPLESTLLDYADSAVLVLDEPEVLDETHQKFFGALEQRFEQTQNACSVAVPPNEIFVSPEDLRAITARHRRVALEELGASGASFFVKGQPGEKFHGRIKDMVEAVRQSHEAGREVVLLGSTIGMAERLRDILHEYGQPFRCEFGEQPLRSLGDATVPIVGIGKISSGLRLPDAGLEIYAETDIFDESEHLPQQHRRRQKISSFLSDLQDLKPGDYVVHIDHGIGTYNGLMLVHDKECMVLVYQGGDRLYVPLERLDLIQKYSSTEGAKPQLDKLGGTTWIARKTRVKRAIRDMAQELLKLYAERKVASGYAFSPDTEWQKEFEEAFQYEETPDQLTAIADIKRDMESPLPMDRLICGDVGYGKTEVAMRAAFKAIADGKQVAVLTPTTVLCYQHFETFKERFAAFPVTIAMLSRFVNPKEQKKIVADMEAGKVDIVIGTHRLLSKDIKFHDLGLMIIDEEQRFGVAHKERLKQIRKQVDVLTMTATPIPRTLNMALSGLRDMSVIETAPRDRLAIQTVVVKFKPAVIENAIDFEIERGGQVYVVHNRVESIYSLANFVQKICPKARVGVAHGQMSEKGLEQVMTRFMHHEFDVLVATTIIENGLDIPLANTLVVNRADRYGLSQLYQLRGRVGRSNRRAYAYLLIPSDDTLTQIARRRLAAIREFSELGAGFRIAALDLELRGAGNLLGGEQHGHIEAIGFDLYCQLLERTIEELRTGEVLPDVETAINLRIDLKIPADFIDEEIPRLRIYKQIASTRTESEVDSMYRDLEDRFGELPLPVRNLLEYARLRILGRARGVTSIERTGQGIDIKFHETARIDPERVVSLVSSGDGVAFVPPATLRLQTPPRMADLFNGIETVLREIAC